MSAPFIAWRHVVKSFGDQAVLQGFSLDVAAGESVAILGASGSGKSVALRHVIGLVSPDSGSVIVGGIDVTAMSEDALRAVRTRVGMVFQGGALFDSMTVGENVRFALDDHAATMSDADKAARVAECLALVQLPGIENAMPASLSGGMKKRVALARTLAGRPEALLYDEPTTGLDPVTTAHVNRVIRDLQARLRVTSVIVTHDVPSALAVADRIVFLESGRVAWDGSVEDARARPSAALAAFMRGGA